MKQSPLMICGEDGLMDPVYVDQLSGLWYFFEENLDNYQGPFTTEDDARRMLRVHSWRVLEKSTHMPV